MSEPPSGTHSLTRLAIRYHKQLERFSSRPNTCFVFGQEGRKRNEVAPNLAIECLSVRSDSFALVQADAQSAAVQMLISCRACRRPSDRTWNANRSAVLDSYLCERCYGPRQNRNAAPRKITHSIAASMYVVDGKSA